MSAFPAKYNQAATFDVPLQITGALDRYTGGTLASGDVKLSIDGGTLNNLTNLPVETPASSGNYPIVLTAAELTGERMMVQFVDLTSPKAFEPRIVLIQTYGHASARHAFDLDTSTVMPSAAAIRAEIDANSTKLDVAVSTRATPADVLAQAAAALTTYDPPTRTEATTDKDAIIAAIPAAGSGLTGAQATKLDEIHANVQG